MTFEEQKSIISEALDKAYTPLEWFEQIIETAYEKGINIQKLPPVKPQLKTGHWIEGKHRDDDIRYNDSSYKCDKCGRIVEFKEYYCPNCGAEMIEPQESEVKDE